VRWHGAGADSRARLCPSQPQVAVIRRSGDVVTPALRAMWTQLVTLSRLRGALPLAAGIFTFVFVWEGHSPPDFPADFDYFWTAGRAVVQGVDPYAAVREGVREGTLRWPLYYPGTAAVIMAPFGALPHRLAVSIFTALGMVLLAWSVERGPSWRRWIVVSAPAIQNVLLGQWSPWLTAAVGLPWLGMVWVAKPTIGLALFAGWPSRAALYGGLFILTLSVALVPGWPAEWIAAVRSTPQYLAPVQRPGGLLLLLAFLRWRRPEARLLGVLSLVPHTVGLYESLPLLLVPQSRRNFMVLMALEYVATLLAYTMVSPGNLAGMLDAGWPYFLVLVYLPCLWMVLRGRSDSPR
jgi:hypothetical protein